MTPPNPDPLRALSDPLRISLFELIKEGPKTTPELAEILNQNRIHLYHHLQVLEQAGFIISQYNSNRVKEYRAQSGHPQIEHQQQVTTITTPRANVSSGGDPDTTRKPATGIPIQTIILSPPSDTATYEEFRELIQQAASICGSQLPEDMKILQIQITSEEADMAKKKLEKLQSVKRNRSRSK